MKTLAPPTAVKVKYLQRTAVFSPMHEHELQWLVERSLVKSCDKGELLFRGQEPARELTMLIRGSVEVFLDLESGEHKVLHLITGPALIAEGALFAGTQWPASARTLSEALIMTVARDTIIDLTRTHPDLPWRIMGGMFRRMREFKSTIENMSRKSAQARVAVYLLGAAPDCPQVVLPAAKNKIANYLGLRPETFSRALAALAKQGAVQDTGDGIMILDRHILEESLEGIGDK